MTISLTFLLRVQSETKNLLCSTSRSVAAVIPRSDVSQPSTRYPYGFNIIMDTVKAPNGSREGCHVRPG
jgi:hypothetical protein